MLNIFTFIAFSVCHSLTHSVISFTQNFHTEAFPMNNYIRIFSIAVCSSVREAQLEFWLVRLLYVRFNKSYFHAVKMF